MEIFISTKRLTYPPSYPFFCYWEYAVVLRIEKENRRHSKFSFNAHAICYDFQ